GLEARRGVGADSVPGGIARERAGQPIGRSPVPADALDSAAVRIVRRSPRGAWRGTVCEGSAVQEWPRHAGRTAYGARGGGKTPQSRAVCSRGEARGRNSRPVRSGWVRLPRSKPAKKLAT